MKEQEAAAKSKGKGLGKQHMGLSGRALFSYNPDLFQDDEQAAANDDYEEIKEQEEEFKASETVPEKEEEPAAVDEALFAAEATGADEEVDFD